MKEIEPGSKVGRLLILERDYVREAERKELGKRDVPYYKCRCDCGAEISVMGTSLSTKRTQSCGCLRNERIRKRGRKVKNLEGMSFGHMRVIKIDDTKQKGYGKHAYWICECGLCGNTKSVRGSDLTTGLVVDCGCQRGYRLSVGSATNLSNVVFGHLTVIDRDFSIGTRSGQHAKWNCMCGLCGRIESIASDMLIRYGKDRCSACAKTTPMGELRIMELLDELGVEYIHDTSSLGCRYPGTNSLLYFDFVVNPNSDEKYIIEFDGIQHFKEVKRWERTMPLAERKKRDAYKNMWCCENNIPLIRIPYTALKKMNVDDVSIITSSFVIKGGGQGAKEDKNEQHYKPGALGPS